MKTLRDIPEGSLFHKQTYIEQIVILQNTFRSCLGSEFVPELSADDISKAEFGIAYRLLSTPGYQGPFFSTFLEGPMAWRHYVPYDISLDDLNCFKTAADNNLWEKYVGLAEYQEHAMGEAVHALSLIGEAWLRPRQVEFSIASPGIHIPSYAQALRSVPYNANIRFVGAMSAKSVADIWAIWHHLMPLAQMQIIDIEGVLSCEAAKHYKIPFVIADGLATGFPDCNVDVVMTNQLITHLGDLYDYDADNLRAKRKLFFAESYRNLRRGGKLIMVEHPLIFSSEEELFEVSVDLYLSQDREALKADLAEVGFSNISIRPALAFANRPSVERFVRKGKGLNPLYYKRQEANHASFLICANK